jgi:VanZ family protein
MSSRALRLLLFVWLPVILWAGLIFAFSAQPDLRFASQDTVDFVVRKAGHMFVFGVLAILLWRALGSAGQKRAMPWSWLLTALYAASDEFHQSFTNGRHPSPVDVGIDCVGATIALGVVAAWLLVGRRRQRRPGGYSPATGSARMLKPPST